MTPAEGSGLSPLTPAADRVAVFHVKLTAIDGSQERRAWDGRPLPSREAHAALDAGVDAFRAAVRNAGFTLVRTGYGVQAVEDDWVAGDA